MSTSKDTNPKDLVGSRKAPLSTLPWRVLYRVGLAMLEGMVKYGRHNYRGVGVRYSVYFDGLQRHIGAWWEGEDIDPESGFHHIDKAIAGLMVLRDSMLQGNCVDDRPPSGRIDFHELNDEASRIVDLHADKSPKHWTIADTPRAGEIVETHKWLPNSGSPPIGLAGHTEVRVRLRSGDEGQDHVHRWDWVMRGGPGDIMSYKVLVP